MGPPPGAIRSFNAEGDHWAWVRGAGAEQAAWAGGPSTAPRRLSLDITPLEAVPVGSDTWVIGTSGEKGALVKIDSAGAVTPMVADLGQPGGLLARDGRVFWIDARPGALSALSFVAAGGAKWQVQVREAEGKVRTLAEYPCSSPPRPGDLVDVEQGAVIVRMRRATSTEILRVPLEGGEPVRLVAEEGDQTCCLVGGTLYWTAPSDEAIAAIRSLKRLSAPGKVDLVAEWVSPIGELVNLGGRLAYLANGVYRFPDHLDQPALERPAPLFAATDGQRVISLEGADAPQLLK